MMSPSFRRAALTAHVVSSVGWLGAVMAFLVLSLLALTTTQPLTLRACYVAMNVIGLSVIVPSSLLALLTGTVQALATPWGLLRYYWVSVKFALTIGATALLILHQFTAVENAARIALASTGDGLPQMGRLAGQLVFDAGFAAVVLLFTTTVSIFKPWGRVLPTNAEGVRAARPLAVRALLIALMALLGAVIVLHLSGHGTGGH